MTREAKMLLLFSFLLATRHASLMAHSTVGPVPRTPYPVPRTPYPASGRAPDWPTRRAHGSLSRYLPAVWAGISAAVWIYPARASRPGYTRPGLRDRDTRYNPGPSRATRSQAL
jgi:hypothetical protein